MRLLARGYQTKQVARALGISVKTADRHIQNAYAKIGVSTRAGATLFAMEQGLVAWGEFPMSPSHPPPVASSSDLVSRTEAIMAAPQTRDGSTRRFVGRSELDQHLETAQAALLRRYAPDTRVRRLAWSQGETQVLELGAGPPCSLSTGP